MIPRTPYCHGIVLPFLSSLQIDELMVIKANNQGSLGPSFHGNEEANCNGLLLAFESMVGKRTDC